MTQYVPKPPPDKQTEVEHTLDAYEKELMQAIEEDKLAPSPGPVPDQEKLEEAARHTLAKSDRITVRLSKPDLHGIKQCAAREGVPYHTLISSLIHKYVTGQLASR